MVVGAGIVLGKAVLGGAIDLAVQYGTQAAGQIKDNWDNGRDLFDIDDACISISWKEVAVSAAFGSIMPGLFTSAKTVKNSVGAIKTISNQSANTANKKMKNAARIARHKEKIADTVATQITWQGAKQTAKCALKEVEEKCNND